MKEVGKGEKKTTSSVPECPVVVITDTLLHINLSPRSATDRYVKSISHSPIEVSGEELLKVHAHLEHILSIT